MLEIKNVSKIYNTAGLTQRALDKVSIKFRENEFVSILGQSGSGKTTMLNIIGGLDKYTSGDLIIDGISTKKYKARDWDTYRNHRIGFVFQSYNLIPHQTALRNVELALTLSGIGDKERKRRSIEVLKSVGLGREMHKKPNQMSGGQMQRVAIARALVNDPDILLADEPTGALDSETSIQIMELLKKIANDKLVIMVTHNPELAQDYSTRIVKLLDGKIIDDTDPFDGEEKEEKEEVAKRGRKKTKKTSMGFLTALSLSLNNLLTKKGRTFLTAFAGSIGIIGIALIMSLSNGIQNYINKTEKETLGSFPLQIHKESVDMSTMITSMMGSKDSEEYNDDLIHSKNIMGDMFTSITKDVNRNDLKSLKEYIESDKSKIKDYATSIDYSYDLELNVYKNDPDSVVRVNPTTVLSTIGMDTNGISSAYSSYMSSYDVFGSMIDNYDFNMNQYDMLAGYWPKEYNELVLIVGKNNEISDYTLYSLGILDQNDLKTEFNNMISGKEVNFESTSYEKTDLLGLEFKVLANTDYYKKTNNVWLNEKNNEEYMKEVLKNADTLKIVGIARPSKDAMGSDSIGTVLYTKALYSHLIEKINNSEIAQEQINNPEINVFTNSSFDNKEFDMNNMTPEQMQYFASLSKEELATLIANMNEYQNSTYENNIRTLGVKDENDPDAIYIYPADFDSKEKIVDVINEYNKDKKEEDKITYTDVVGLMMDSVTNIVNVVSKVLIAFVAISLVVSSIMIAIITYISVIERTKEIGILRAIGASKKDVSRVFNAETLIEGACAGALGIGVTLLINIPINILIEKALNIKNIAALPTKGAFILIIISIVLTLIAGLIPSRMASKKDPVEALRTE